MKKIKYLIFISTIFIISGCSKEKVLKCTANKNYNDGLMITQNISIKYKVEKKKEKMIKVDKNMTIDITDKYIEFKNEFAKTLKQEYEIYQNKAGIEYELVENETNYSFKFNIDIPKITDDTKTKLSQSINFDEDYNTAKLNLEQKEYTCE